ncbi:hypothetical protein RIF29_24594 [Crotalaria pallida]|uniref:Nicotianamine synthase n=1 Tax=Crotalaria pallida TaxID=3830 RepID=A0AAN9I0B9_CROPI
MVCQEELLVEKVCDLYDQISSLESLKPCKNVDMLFTQLVLTCMAPIPIDVTKLNKSVQEIRSKLIRLCGVAEGHLESHYSTILGSYENPLEHLHIFPYYNNYLKLGLLEFNILSQHITNVPNKIAFVGSGPLPLTSIVLASKHLVSTTFHNYDIDPLANSYAQKLVSNDPGLSNRMVFHTNDILDVTKELEEFEVVYLAALVGMDKESKNRVIDHLAKYMAPGAFLMLRSAHGARAFLYPVVEPCDLRGFEVLSVFHPTDEVINSVVIAHKYDDPMITIHSSSSSLEQGLGNNNNSMILPNKCSEIQVFNPLNHGNMIEELTTVEEQHS